MVFILLFLIAGIMMGRYLQKDTALFLAVSVLGTAGVFLLFKKNIVIVLPLALLLGFALVSARLSPRDAAAEARAQSGETVTVSAVVLETGKTGAGNSKAIVSAGKMRLMVYFGAAKAVRAGDLLTITGTFAPPDFQRNPGGFDETQYFRARKIDYKVLADSAEKIGEATGAYLFIPQIRETLGAVFDKALPEKEAGIMKAMIIGDKTGLTEATDALYRAAGIYHILAVSGLHVSIVAWIVGSLFARALPEKKADVFTILFLLFYCVLSGAGVATVRAVIMAVAGLCGGLCRRKGDSVVTTSFAAICLLVYEPFYLWDIGFQYSFSAVYGLILGTPAFERLFVRIKGVCPAARRFLDNGYIRKYLAGTLAATTATLPVMICYFYTVIPVSVLTNLLIVPTVVFVVSLGIIISVTGLFGIALTAPFALACRFILDAYEWICETALKLPFARILIGAAGLPLLAGIYVVFGLFCYYMAAEPAEEKKRGWYFFASGAAVLLFAAASAFYPARLTVAMLDVGQGDGFVLSRGATDFMIDGGGNFLKGVGDNTGKNVVLPYLDYLGKNDLDAAFVTHTDADHAIGVLETMAEKRVGTLFLPASAETDSTYHALLIAAAKENGTALRYLSAGEEIVFGGDIRVRCLFPTETTALKGNDGALVLRVSYGEADFLFTGDIGFDAEKELLASGAALGADVLKIAHHGSKYATGDDFLDAVQPKIALISAGKNNTYGHPTPEVLEKLNERTIRLYQTPDSGAVLIKTDGDTLSIKTMAGH
jgi:competence protein ComEC